MRRQGRGRSLTGTASVLLSPQGHIPGAPGRLLLPSSGSAGSLACPRVRPPARAAVALRPRGVASSAPARQGPAAASGRGRGGERGPPPSAQTHSRLSGKSEACSQLPSGQSTDGAAGPGLVSLDFATEAASASSTVKWGQTELPCGAETKGLLGNGGFLALPESCVSRWVLSSIRNGDCPLHSSGLSSWRSAWYIADT